MGMLYNYTAKSIIKRLLREHIRPYRGRIGFAVLCMIIAAATQPLQALLIKPVVNNIFINHDRQMLLLIPFAVFIVTAIGAAANYGNIVSMRYVGQRIVADMQKRLFGHLMHSDIGLFHSQSSGRMISRFTNDINLMRNAFSNILTSLAKEMLSMLFLIGVMFYQNTELAIVALLVFPIAILPVIRLSRRMRKISHTTQEELGGFTATLDEIFQGVRTVKSYNREEFEISRAGSIIESLFRLYYKASRVQTAATPIMEVLSGVSIASVIWYGGFQVLDGQTTAGDFFSFITAFLMAYKPVRSVAGMNTTLQEGLVAAARLFSTLDTPPLIVDRANARPLVIERGHIRFDSVTFTYKTGKVGVEHINLDIPAGKTAALVGLSGGGKSTLMNLLLRFYELDSGSITIDGQDIRSVTLHSLRHAMAFVPQETMLFDDTILANIAYGRVGASKEDIMAAAHHAAADEFIRALPDGYDAMIGAHGVRLSGGQRQRIAIARAILKNAPILLLDEATSSLDNESERSIQQALQELMHGRTTLVIAHRLSTIVNADIIYVMEAGRIIESGTHTSLMQRQGKYFQLYAQNLEIETAR